MSSLDFLKKLSDPLVLVILLLWVQFFFSLKTGFLSVNFIFPVDLLFLGSGIFERCDSMQYGWNILFTSPVTLSWKIRGNLDAHQTVPAFLVFIFGSWIFPRNKWNNLWTASGFLCEMKAGSFSTGLKTISPQVLIKQCLHLKSGLLIGN